jgi:hypothetical protein
VEKYKKKAFIDTCGRVMGRIDKRRKGKSSRKQSRKVQKFKVVSVYRPPFFQPTQPHVTCFFSLALSEESYDVISPPFPSSTDIRRKKAGEEERKAPTRKKKSFASCWLYMAHLPNVPLIKCDDYQILMFFECSFERPQNRNPIKNASKLAIKTRFKIYEIPRGFASLHVPFSFPFFSSASR